MTKNTENVNNNRHLPAIKAAFPHTLPIMAAFLFLGISYGIMMSGRGFSFVVPMMTSLFVYAGSLEFALANLLVGGFSPVEAALLGIAVNARHIFYGISMLEKYRGTGLKKLYLIFALSDETFSVNYTAQPPEGVDRGLFMTYISLFDHLYWVVGATLGGLLGGLIPMNIVGIDFAMTAMFAVIVLEQILKGKENIPSLLIGVISSALCLITFGKDSFIIPSMLLMLVSLALARAPISELYLASGGQAESLPPERRSDEDGKEGGAEND